MTGALYTVCANGLNLRQGAGTEAQVLQVLPKGTQVTFLAESDVAGWWRVNAPPEGYVARQYLTAQSSAGWRPEAILDEVLWYRTEACAGKVTYCLGAKHSAQGQIDCSGWVTELTCGAFDAVNAAAAPDVLFHHPDYTLFNTHSDGIVSGIEGRTGFALHGPAVTEAALKPGMLIGCNFGDYAWEKSIPPRVYGIDHIVQVMRQPGSDALFITQSSHSGGGVNRQPLAAWLADRVRGGMMAAGKIHAVDPFLLLDQNTGYARRQAAAAGIVPAPVTVPAVAAPAAAPSPFAGRSFFILSTPDLIRAMGSIATAVDELVRCKADAIWVRVHGRGYLGESPRADPAQLLRLIAAARSRGIAVAGWGWCQGEDPAADAGLGDQAVNTFKIDGYMADIEDGVNNARWPQDKIVAFATAFRARHPDLPFGITSHGFIPWHSPELLDKAMPLFDCVNPQAYWDNHYPLAGMLSDVGKTPADYPLTDAASYARLCADVWRARYKRPVVIAGTIAPETDFSSDDALAKLRQFLTEYRRPDGVIGEAFWHFGAATPAIRDLLANGVA